METPPTEAILASIIGYVVQFNMKKIIKYSTYLLSPIAILYIIFFSSPAIAQETIPKNDIQCLNYSGKCLDISPEVVEDSPTLQKWLQQTPNVLEDIRNDPSFVTRFRWGFSSFPDSDDGFGVNIAVEDLFINRTGLTISADYYTDFNSDRSSLGTDLHYFLFPLGSHINLAPTLGYRYLENNNYDSDGINLGLRLMLALSRTGAADISLAQSFLSPGTDEEVGIFSVSVGYGVTSNLRLSTEFELQNLPQEQDTRLGINLEWAL